MLPIAQKLDAVGCWSLEVWGGATFDTCLRFLKEDPWERLRALRAAMPNTKLQMLLRGQNLVGYRHYADDVLEQFIERSAANGIDVFRIFDALNDIRNVERAMREVKACGKHVEAAISYTVSPVHSVERFVDTGETGWRIWEPTRSALRTWPGSWRRSTPMTSYAVSKQR